LYIFQSRRSWICSLLIAAGIALFTGCGGVSLGHSNGNGGSVLTASLATLSFGDVPKSKSSNLSETLTNAGGSAVTISGANVSGTGFSVSGLSLPMSLSSGHSVTFTVTFAPTSSAQTSGMLTVLSTAANSPVKIPLTGTESTQGQLSVSPQSLSFGSVVIGDNSSQKGTLAASGAGVTISAANVNSSEFVLSGISLPITLTDGQTASFTVTFKPAIAGTASAALSFSSDAANSPATQSLSGNGTEATQHSVALNWEASSGPDVVGYNVYRGGVAGGPYSRINSALEASTEYADNTVTAGQTYYYVTTAVNGNGTESAYSNQAKAEIPTP
jgi:hypothetical protein